MIGHVPGRQHAWALAAMALLAASPAVSAEFIEQTTRVPVEIRRPGEAPVSQDLAMMIVRQDTTGRQPFLVLHHGRGATARERAAIGLQAYPANSRYFASLGFVVLIPTRVGYGVTRGPDVEFTGSCRSKRYADGVAAAVTETRQVLAYAERLPYLDPDRGIVVGESFGGLAAIAVAATDIRGVVGVVNIAGGDGGDSRRRVDEPCRPDLLRETFASYGLGNRLPTLWMYSRNDRVWGSVYPTQWYDAFVRAGGKGEFISLPADKNNGHFIFNRNAPAWRPAFERFLKQLELLPADP